MASSRHYLPSIVLMLEALSLFTSLTQLPQVMFIYQGKHAIRLNMVNI